MLLCTTKTAAQPSTTAMADPYAHCRFRLIRPDEIPVMFDLIRQRMAWMDRIGIRQWNVTHYDTVYPLSYYEAHRRSGEVFVLSSGDDSQILAAAVLRKDDERWQHIPGYCSDRAVYLHNFASRADSPGAGSAFLKKAELYAKEMGYRYFRLDSAIDNPVLTEYYTVRGYLSVGQCIDGLYSGILRQKEL